MTLDARGKGMTPVARHVLVRNELKDQDFGSVRLHRGCDAGNTGACLFGSTLALHSIEFCAVRVVAHFAIGSRKCEAW
jgi:hypothetical protein